MKLMLGLLFLYKISERISKKNLTKWTFFLQKRTKSELLSTPGSKLLKKCCLVEKKRVICVVLLKSVSKDEM